MATIVPGNISDVVKTGVMPRTCATRLLGTTRNVPSALLSVSGPGAAPQPESVLFAHLPGAEKLVFSAPSVREIQFDGPGGQVFSLNMEGLIVGLTGDLLELARFSHELAPLRVELAMAELPQPGGRVLCYLYYVGSDGGIVALDASTDIKRLPSRWLPKGTLVPAKVLPLRCQDGLLFGGGILGFDFFAMELDPAKPPQCGVNSPSERWVRYDLAGRDMLAILTGIPPNSDGASSSRVVAYGRGVNLRDRSGLRVTNTNYTTFWSGTGQESSPASPTLMLEIFVKADVEFLFRVLLANTVDTELQPAYTPGYPPAASVLGVNTLGRPAGETARIRTILCRPVVLRQMVYCVVRCDNPAKDLLVSYAIGPIQNEVAAEAAKVLQQNTAASRPIWLQINEITDFTCLDRAGRLRESECANTDVLVIWEAPGESLNPPSGERRMRTNGRGQIPFETDKVGYGIRVSPNFKNSISKCYDVGEISGRRLEKGSLNFIRFTKFLNYDL